MEAIAVDRAAPVPPCWTVAIDRAVDEPDPELANLLVTQVHHELGAAVRALLGPEAGANFHAWATWGSREAGTTIRMADVPALHHVLPARPALHRARAAVSEGNRMVLDEIGRETARFVEAGGAHRTGIDGLATAFDAYRAAMRGPGRTVAARRRAACTANFAAVWHEHVRLQPCIARAMPRGLRHLITRTLLDYRVGAHHLHVARDVGPGTAARDWSDFGQRMRYVRALFEARHLDPQVFAPPYGAALTAELRRELGLDRVPLG